MQFDQLKRREFITLLGGATAWPLLARAQQTARFYRVAYLALLVGQDVTIVKQRLNELGYTEGKNLTFDFRSAEGQPERLPDLATELVRASPDVIVAGFGTLTAKAAQAATTSTPVVFTSVGDPIGAGIVKSLNRPGANITGLHPQATEITGKRLQILLELVPGIRIVAVLLNPDTPFSALALQELRVAADTQGRDLEICEVRMPHQLSPGIEAAARAGATGLMVLEDPLLLSLRQQIVDLAAKLRLFAAYASRDFVNAGGLLSYGTDRRQLYRRAAEFVDKILKGEKPADIPVERPTKFELIINFKAANALGLTIPNTLIVLADEVIE
jgi:putative tryptophan/tyrosine transport system substrate-binding protein